MGKIKHVFLLISVCIFLGSAGVALADSQVDIVLDYTNSADLNLNQKIPSQQPLVLQMGMRFTNTEPVACSLKTVSLLLANIAAVQNDTTGDLRVQVYSVDSAGLPAALLHDEIILNSQFEAGWVNPVNQVDIDLTQASLIFPSGGEWCVTVQTDPVSAQNGDTLIFLSDEGTLPTGRWVEQDSDGIWQNANCCHLGIDVNMEIYSTIGTITANNPPVLDPIGPQVFDENQADSFFVTGSDPDDDNFTFQVQNLPLGASFDSVAQGWQFNWTPNFDQSGLHIVTFIITDDSGATDQEAVSVQVNNTNRPPLLNAIGPQNTNEGVNLNFIVTATDPDGTISALSTSQMPPGAGFVDNANDSGVFDWTPTFNQAGVYDITFYASDGVVADSEVVTITVDNINQPPVLAPISPDLFVEGQFGSFNVSGFDPDGGIVTLTTSTLPTGALFTDSGDGTGAFEWTPDFSQQGVHDVTFYVTDDSSAVDSAEVELNVLDVVCSDLTIETFTLDGPQEISNGRDFQSRLNLTVENLSPSSVDSQVTITFYYSGIDGKYNLGSQTVDSFLPGPHVVEITDTVTMNPDANNGPAFLVVEIDDASYTDCDPLNNSDSIPFLLVNNIDPVLDSIGNRQVNEGENLSFLATASDADGDPLSMNVNFFYPGLISQPSIVDSGNGKLFFDWTPSFGDSGVYDFQFIVDDGQKSFDEEIVTITVNNLNRPPQLDSLPDTMFVAENSLLAFLVSSNDPDGDCVELSMFSPNLPPAAQFLYVFDCVTNGDFSWQTTFNDSGIYNAFFVVSEVNQLPNPLADTQEVVIVVQNSACADLSVSNFMIVDSEIRVSIGNPLDKRLAASVENIGETTTGGASTIAFYVSTDSVFDSQIDQLLVNGRVVVGSVDAGNVFDVSLSSNMTIPFNFSPGPAYLFMVADELQDIAECDEQNNLAVISVTLVYNIPPVAVPTPDTTIDENQSLTLTILGYDPDSLPVFYSFRSIPTGATLTDSGDGSATFEWTPNYFDAGNYQVIFIIYDNSESAAEDTVIITVNNVNRPPVFEVPVSDMTVNEGQQVSFFAYAFDLDNEPVLYSAESPTISSQDFSFTDDGEGSGEFNWTPGFADAGVHTFYLYAADSLGGQDTDTVLITVNNINVPPVLDNLTLQEVNENELLEFLVTATDIDGTIPSLSTGSSLPAGASFDDNGDGSGTFNWTPDCNQSLIEGSYSVIFYAQDDSGATDTGVVSIFVNENCDVQLSVDQATCVQCVPPQNYSDILVFDRGFNIEFNNQVDPGTIDGNIAFSSRRGSSFDYFYNEKLKQIEVLPTFGVFATEDTIMVSLNTNILDLSESPLDSSYNLVYRTGGLVYPGDCNNDGAVNEIDVLSIGLYFSNTGPSRDSQYFETGPFDFLAQPVHFVQGLEEWTPARGAYADADGSGVVDANDICGVAANFGQIVIDGQFSTSSTAEKISTLKEYGSSVLQAMYDALIGCEENNAPELVVMIERALRESSPILPTEVTLYQNYPNPFNPSTVIEFFLPESQKVTLEIYNLLGQRVTTLLNENTEAGFKEVNWNGNDNSGAQVASGIYFYKLVTETKVETKRMLLVK